MVLNFWLSLLLSSSIAAKRNGQNINVVFLIDWTDKSESSVEHLYGPLIGSASALAVKTIQDMKLLSQYNLENWTFVDTHCLPKGAKELITVWDTLPGRKIHGIIGPGCTSCLILTALSSSFNLPQVRLSVGIYYLRFGVITKRWFSL